MSNFQIDDDAIELPTSELPTSELPTSLQKYIESVGTEVEFNVLKTTIPWLCPIHSSLSKVITTDQLSAWAETIITFLTRMSELTEQIKSQEVVGGSTELYADKNALENWYDSIQELCSNRSPYDTLSSEQLRTWTNVISSALSYQGLTLQRLSARSQAIIKEILTQS